MSFNFQVNSICHYAILLLDCSLCVFLDSDQFIICIGDMHYISNKPKFCITTYLGCDGKLSQKCRTIPFHDKQNQSCSTFYTCVVSFAFSPIVHRIKVLLPSKWILLTFIVVILTSFDDRKFYLQILNL